FDEVATDDAVINLPSSNLRAIATGEWRADNNPLGEWENRYQTIYYLNLFLEIVDSVDWAPLNGEPQRTLHRNRLIGEAHGLRAWHMFQLLRLHSGVAADGRLLGFPIILEPLEADDNLELPRNTYEECVNQIVADLEIAISNLTDRYEDYDDGDSTVTLGNQWGNRMNRLAAKALKARVLLHAASPSFNLNGEASKWEAAAQAAGELLAENGGLSALSITGLEWYEDPFDPDVIWRRNISQTNSWELNNFPPSKAGLGRTNPTQNLVDAFPMANGLPIDAAASGYDPSNPYLNRDARLDNYIVYNGSILGGTPINTFQGAGDDGLNQLTNFSTRTSYYLRKFMDESVSLIPNSQVQTQHYYTFFRFTEVFLIYAEAANEAYGPDADPNGYGFTAREVVEAIRQRAGIISDEYLGTVNGRDAFRELARNERRLELCFEGFRFWDLRRWGVDLTQPARGVVISDGFPATFSYTTVEERSYQPYMIYGPIPFNETLKYDLLQNQGW
ncbi:MAG: RagB/SusD family nutrient uptake outer membrane protein, partial [Bacteroidota bacterium]